MTPEEYKQLIRHVDRIENTRRLIRSGVLRADKFEKQHGTVLSYLVGLAIGALVIAGGILGVGR